MKIVLAPDSYKDSLNATDVADIMEDAIQSIDANIHTIKKPMADGGEGTLHALSYKDGIKIEHVQVIGPLGNYIDTHYAMTEDRVAIIEMAKVAGLELVPLPLRNPLHTTTYGMGELMIDAYEKGCRSFIIGIGGSATNDGGLGMLQALGMLATDRLGHSVSMFGEGLLKVEKINLSNLAPWLDEVTIHIASDVDNPLCGQLGATYVFGPQKGLALGQLEKIDEAMRKYSNLLERTFNKSCKTMAGAGAAGGIGFALLLLGAKIEPGAQLIANMIQLEEAIKGAHLVFTGEGKSDEQTLYGKAPSYIAEIGKRHHVPTILVSGSIAEQDALLRQFTGCFSIAAGPITLEESVAQARHLLRQQMQQIIHVIISIQKNKKIHRI